MTHSKIEFDLKCDKDLENILESKGEGRKLVAYALPNEHVQFDKDGKFQGSAYYLNESRGVRRKYGGKSVYCPDDKYLEISCVHGGSILKGKSSKQSVKRFDDIPNVDIITQYLNFIENNVAYKYGKIYYDSTIKIHLASWVARHLLEKYDINCTAQLKNIGRLGDSESLFAGGDACERIQKLMTKADSD